MVVLDPPWHGASAWLSKQESEGKAYAHMEVMSRLHAACVVATWVRA